MPRRMTDCRPLVIRADRGILGHWLDWARAHCWKCDGAVTETDRAANACPHCGIWLETAPKKEETRR